MKQKRRDEIILIIITTMIMTLLLISISWAILKENGTEIEIITAIEGRTFADDVAKKWHDDALLVDVGSMGMSDSSGRASKWSYKYISLSTTIIDENITKYERAYVYVMSNGTITVKTAFRVKDEIGEPILNWTIDSDQAVEIAKENSEIKEYLSKYSKAQLGLNLRMEDEYPNNAIWSIGWADQGWFDDPHNAHIVIDAHTGEVLEVEVQMD